MTAPADALVERPINACYRRLPAPWWLAVAVAAVVAACGYTGRVPPSASPQAFTPRPALAATAAAPLTDLLRSLTVVAESPDGYNRAQFRLWVDEDADGCDTREEVLIAQAIAAPTIRGICEIVAGSWISEYDRLTLTDPTDVQVDHVVPLAEAWASGASAWTPARRERYANDLGVPWALIAVSAATNQAKGASDPTEWLPPRRADVCPYVAAWIGVKVRWSLSVDPAERVSLARLADQCPNTRIVAPVAPD